MSAYIYEVLLKPFLPISTYRIFGWAFSPNSVSRISFVYKDLHFWIDVSNDPMCCFLLFVWCGE